MLTSSRRSLPSALICFALPSAAAPADDQIRRGTAALINLVLRSPRRPADSRGNPAPAVAVAGIERPTLIATMVQAAPKTLSAGAPAPRLSMSSFARDDLVEVH